MNWWGPWVTVPVWELVTLVLIARAVSELIEWFIKHLRWEKKP